MGSIRELKGKAAGGHPLEWLLEPLEQSPTYVRRKMFGCESVYLNGKLVLVLSAGEEPWNGLMVVTAREFHPDLCKEWPQLCSHAVLGKWLYLSQSDPQFERIACAVVKRIQQGDPRIGVEPKPRKRASAGKAAGKSGSCRGK